MTTKQKILKEFHDMYAPGYIQDEIKRDIKQFLSKALDTMRDETLKEIKKMEKGDQPTLSASAMIVLEELKS